MAAQVLSFFQRSPRYAPAPVADWSQQELAEFYRVEAALIRAGIRVGTDRGLSDEKEPWFVFYRTDDGEVVIHFARIDGEYLIAGPAYEEIARGFDFSSMVRNMVARHPLIRRSDRGDNVSIHPAALLVAVVGTAFFKSGEARAAESGATNPAAHSRPALLSSTSNTSLTGGAATPSHAVAANAQAATYDTVQLPANQAMLVLAAAVLAADFKVDGSSLEPSAQAAMASAAVSLDFNSPVARDLSSVGVENAATTDHAAAVAKAPAQAVSSVLSLIALLSTLPHSTDLSLPADASPNSLVAPSQNEDLAPTLAHVTSPSPAAAPLPVETANWSLQVRFGAGALPNIEAVQLVRALVGDGAAAQKITVIEVSKLPDLLAEIISRGEHVQVAPIAIQPGASAGEPPLTPPVSEATPSDSNSGQVQPSEQTHTDVSTPTQAQPPASHVVFISAQLVQKVLDYFIANTEHIVWATGTNSQVTLLDERVTTDPSAIHHITSVTVEMADHSQIHLVGDLSSFWNGGIF